MEIVVFTNGCFDLLHPGHVELLKKARSLGTKLIVGLNSDRSVRALKGNPRPFLNQNARARILKELRAVDEVLIFDENTPEKLIKELKPDVLVKGGDWLPEQIIGANFVLQNGGKVFSIPFESDYSSSRIAEKIKNSTDAAASEIKNRKNARLIEKLITENFQNFQNFSDDQMQNVFRCMDLVWKATESGNKIWFCMENEVLVSLRTLSAGFFEPLKIGGVLFKYEESNTPTTLINFNQNVSREIKENLQKGDLLIAVNQNGNSNTMLEAVMLAREIDCRAVCVTGIEGKKLASLCDANISVSAKNTFQFTNLVLAVIQIGREVIDFKLKERNKT